MAMLLLMVVQAELSSALTDKFTHAIQQEHSLLTLTGQLLHHHAQRRRENTATQTTPGKQQRLLTAPAQWVVTVPQLTAGTIMMQDNSAQLTLTTACTTALNTTTMITRRTAKKQVTPQHWLRDGSAVQEPGGVLAAVRCQTRTIVSILITLVQLVRQRLATARARTPAELIKQHWELLPVQQ
jgi:hypothetical protein